MKKEEVTIKPSKFEVFGIPVESSSGNATDIMSMMAFLGECKADNVIHYINGLVYDDVEDKCRIATAKIVQKNDPVGTSLIRKAAKVFGLFCIFGEDAGYKFKMKPM